MPKKRAAKAETLLELCGGDEVKAASIQNLIIMCGLEFLDWIADETDLWQRMVAGGDKIALFVEMERRCPPAIWEDHQRHVAYYRRLEAWRPEREAGR